MMMIKYNTEVFNMTNFTTHLDIKLFSLGFFIEAKMCLGKFHDDDIDDDDEDDDYVYCYQTK